MTVVVAFLCTDGVVVAADSMLTSSMGQLNVAHHTGQKITVENGNQVFAYAGDQGLGHRFRIVVGANHAAIAGTPHAIDYPIALTRAMVAQFKSTGVANNGAVNTVLGFVHPTGHQCCIFEGAIQPRLLDQDHFYMALGSGKLGADPFLRFLVDTFCGNGQPTVREAIFLATWVVEHVIRTNPGGVAAPIRVAVLEQNAAGAMVARKLPPAEIEEHKQAIESAEEALRAWRDGLLSGAAAEDVPEPPAAPQAPAAGANN